MQQLRQENADLQHELLALESAHQHHAVMLVQESLWFPLTNVSCALNLATNRHATLIHNWTLNVRCDKRVLQVLDSVATQERMRQAVHFWAQVLQALVF